MRRLILGIAALVLAASALVACAPQATKHNVAGYSAHVDSATHTVLRVPSGVTVSLPASSVSGSGELTVTKASRGELAGWSIALRGAKLTGPAKLMFAGKPTKGEPAPIVAYTEDLQTDLTPVAKVTVTSSGAEVTTTHFSFWFVDWWSDIAKKVHSAINALFSPDANGLKPSCVGEADIRSAGYQVTSSDDDRVYWCMGTGGQSGRPRLTIVNARDYPVAVQETSNMVLSNPDNSMQSLLSQLFATLSFPKLPAGQSMHLLQGGASYTYDVTSDTEQGLQVTQNGPAYLASAIMYGVSTVTLLISLFGGKVAQTAVTAAFDSPSCMTAFKSMTGTKITSVDSAATYMQHALEAVSSCLGKVIEKAYGNHGLIVSTLLAGLSWLISGIDEVRIAKDAVVDFVKHPAPYEVRVSKSVQFQVSEEKLLSVEAPAMCKRPAGHLVNGELPVDDPIRNGGTTILNDGKNNPPIYAQGVTPDFPSGIVALEFGCSAGGVGWPMVIGFYDSNLELIGSLNFQDLDHQEHSDLQSLVFANDGFDVTWITNDDTTCHTGADESIPRSGHLAIDKAGKVTVSNLTTGQSSVPCP